MRTTPEVCGKCDARTVIRASDVTSGDVWLTVHADRHPEAVLRKGRRSTNLVAFVCTSCGYTELYADDPASLIAP